MLEVVIGSILMVASGLAVVAAVREHDRELQIIAIIVSVAAIFAAVAFKPKPAQAVEPRSSTVHECHQEGHDCIDWMQQAGPEVYCQWAGNMAAIGADMRNRGMGRKVPVRFGRPFTDNEVKHIAEWADFGWQRGGDLMETQRAGYAQCMKGMT